MSTRLLGFPSEVRNSTRRLPASSPPSFSGRREQRPPMTSLRWWDIWRGEPWLWGQTHSVTLTAGTVIVTTNQRAVSGALILLPPPPR